MPFRAVILEGVAGSGKSSLLRALLAHPRFVNRPGSSSLVLTEHHTQRVLEALGARSSLRVEDHLGLLRGHVDYLASIASRLDRMTRWKRDHLENPRFVAIVERFHLTHVLNYAHLEWSDVAALDRQLASLGAALCVTTAAQRELRARLASRGPDWGTFLREPGQRHHLRNDSSPTERADYFVAQQATLRELAARSSMTRIEIDTSALTPEAAAERVLDHLVGANVRG
jgi:hypothetical protein